MGASPNDLLRDFLTSPVTSVSPGGKSQEIAFVRIKNFM